MDKFLQSKLPFIYALKARAATLLRLKKSRHVNSAAMGQDDIAIASVPKQIWSRSDIIALWAFSISILSVAITFIATAIAYKADQRAQQADIHGAEAVISAVGDKVRLLVNDSEMDGMFIGGFLDHAEQHPENSDEVAKLTFEYLQDLTLPDLELTTEKLTLLAHSDNDAASKLVLCSSRRAEVESDIKNLATAKKNKMTHVQANTLRLLPYRLHKLSETCKQATESLASMAPALPSMRGSLRGTVGELVDAEAFKQQRKDAGFNMTLTLPQKNGEKTSQTSQKPQESRN